MGLESMGEDSCFQARERPECMGLPHHDQDTSLPIKWVFPLAQGVTVSDRKGLYQPACQEVWKKCEKKNSTADVMYKHMSICVM